MQSKTALFLFFPLILTALFQFRFNNTCRSYLGYFNIFFSSDCHYDPDVEDDVLGIIRRHVGFSETHQVQTEDGYILSLFRIPRENPRGVILLQHAIYFDAKSWVSQFNESIAFLFWRAGYDVWLGNSRGSLYSKRHVKLQTTDREFWNYSFHEMGYYDHPATIGYIAKKTKSKIVYMGYSMASSTGLVYASTKPEEAAGYIKLMILLAPVSNLKSGTSVAKYIVPPLFYLHSIVNFVDLRSTIFKDHTWFVKIARTIFKFFPCKMCIVYMNCMISGWTPDEFDPNLVNVVIQSFGSEIPLKIAHHFYQIYKSGGDFQMYDYGEGGNLRMYGEKKPPLYPLEKIKLPVYLIYGENDTFTCPEDNEVLYSKLPKESKIHGKLMVEGFNHGDFSVGRHRNERVYDKILRLLEKIQ